NRVVVICRSSRRGGAGNLVRCRYHQTIRVPSPLGGCLRVPFEQTGVELLQCRRLRPRARVEDNRDRGPPALALGGHHLVYAPALRSSSDLVLQDERAVSLLVLPGADSIRADHALAAFRLSLVPGLEDLETKLRRQLPRARVDREHPTYLVFTRERVQVPLEAATGSAGHDAGGLEHPPLLSQAPPQPFESWAREESVSVDARFRREAVAFGRRVDAHIVFALSPLLLLVGDVHVIDGAPRLPPID
ncbi:unnamed protein product, partial [Ectocarpus fasciculatus]